MTPLAGPARSQPRSAAPFWLMAMLAAAGLHLLALAACLWQPARPLPPQPQAAPMAIELVMPLAAPSQPVTDLPPGPQQVQASAARATPQTAQQGQPDLPALPDQAQAEVALPKPEPEPIVHQPAKAPPTEQAEMLPEPLNPSADQLTAAKTSAPPSAASVQHSETLQAPAQGALRQQQLDARQHWEQLLYAHLEQHKRYPRQALRAHQQGMPTITLTMNRSGQVITVELAGSSGARTLDREALALAKRAEPLPLPPPEISGEQITLTVPVFFSL
ncbi:TonB family protein [Halopseudomonas sp.]|uniref:TonB family protein n=1 Tax=Halopseudomonas sp. TaxID=2901191 RepID=UPI0030020AAE